MTENKKKIEVNEEFIIKLGNKRYVEYAGLLDVAHQIGLKSLVVSIIQMPSEENSYVAICEAVGETDDGRIFSDIGDAAPNSLSRNLIPHLIRMASTRAKARVLRDLTNIGITALEEMDLETAQSGKIPRSNDLSKMTAEAIKLQNVILSKGKGQQLASITGGRSVESIDNAETLTQVINKMKEFLES